MTTDVGDHVMSRAFRCTACERQFVSRKYLSMHIALHKMAAEPPPPVAAVVGGDIGRGGAATTAPVRHNRGGGSISQQWSCPVCGKTFAQNSNFRNHVRTHSDERPYVCLVCLIGFKERYHLKKHTLFKHSPGQLNEACRQCGKRFKDLTAVRAHERTHSDARPYSCSRCDKTFKTSECLWHHENRSKSCGRITSAGGESRSLQNDVPACTGFQSSFRRRRRNRITTGGCDGTLQATASGVQSSTTEAAAAVATLLEHFVESSSTQSADVTALSPPVDVSTSESERNTASFGTRSDSVIAELFDCDISDLWTSSLTSDGVTSFYDDNVDINMCTPTSCFDDLMVTTTDAASKCRTGGGTTVINGQQWNESPSLCLPSHADRRSLTSFDVSCSSDAAFRNAFSHSEKQLLYDQSMPDFSAQQPLSLTVSISDGRSMSSCSAATDTYDDVRSSKPTSICFRALVEPTSCTGSAGSYSYLPTAVVAPIKRDRQHDGVTTSTPEYPVSSLHAPLVKTFHLPPIETFAPRRPVVSTRQTWPSCYQHDVVPRDLVRRPQQQCPTVARYLMTSAGARHHIVPINNTDLVGSNQLASCWQYSAVP